MKHLSTLLLLFSLTIGAAAQQAQMGFVNVSKVVSKNSARFGSDVKQALAIKLPQSKAQLLKGAKISGIRTIQGTSNIANSKTMRIFVTTDLNGTPLAEKTVSAPGTKWGSSEFDTPIEITGEELYIGYEVEPVSGFYSPLVFDKTGDFAESYSWALENGQWVDISQRGYGGAAIILLIDDAPQFSDIIMKSISSGEYLKEGQSPVFGGEFYNFGTQSVTSFDLTCKVGDAAPYTSHVEGVEVAPNSSYTFTLPDYTLTTSGTLPLVVTATNINGMEQSADDSDDIIQKTIGVYPADMTKKVLVEVFTGQDCSQCPAGHRALASGLANIEDQVVEVSHHAGYYPDFFTMAEDMEYTWFYAGSTYAPTCMFNRAPYADGISSVVFVPTASSSLNAAIAASTASEPYVGIKLHNSYTASTRSGQVSVELQPYSIPDASIEQYALNVWLKQSGIVASQSGAGSNYVHDNVFRASLTGVWGKGVTLVPGETVNLTFDYSIPESYSANYEGVQTTVPVPATPEDMGIVVFVSKPGSDPLGCIVMNAEEVGVTTQSPDGIHGVSTDKAAPTAYYDLQGRRVMQPVSGNIYITNTGRKVFFK